MSVCGFLVYVEGLEYLHLMTELNGKQYVLRADLQDWQLATAYAEYDNFRVDSSALADLYRCSSLGAYSGTAGTPRVCRPVT